MNSIMKASIKTKGLPFIAQKFGLKPKIDSKVIAKIYQILVASLAYNDKLGGNR